MAERTMEELLRAPTKGYGEAIVLPEINADHFEIKTNLLQLVQANPFYGRESENPHAHFNSIKRITSTLRFRNVPNDVIKLMMFPYSLERAAKTCEAWERVKELLRACPHQGFMDLTQVDTFYNSLNENEQDSLNVAAGGNLLSKTTREALNIIENKSKVRYSRNRSNASMMNATSSKMDERIDKLADKISTLVEIVSKKVVTPAPVKAVEETCVTYGGAHSWYNYPATDNNQASVCATTGIYNQVNPPNRISSQMTPPGFAPVQNNGQNRFNQNQGQGNNFNRGNNFHGNQGFQAQNSHALKFSNQGFQNQPFQVPNNQVQQEMSNDFSSYKRNDDQMLRNMQNQINSLKGDLKNEIQNTIKSQQAVMMNQQTTFQNNLQNMICGLFQNQASTSGSLPSNTIPNPKVERETEEITDKEQTNFQGSTTHIPPPVIPISIPEPDVSKSLPKSNIPYPSRDDDQKSRDKASNQMENISQIFQDLRFDISFADTLLLMPIFAPTIKSLLMNKEKLLELAKIPLNENFSAMLLKKLPEKIGDPGKFLIPCNFPGMDVCYALANLGASINLMPLSIWKKLSLPYLTPTRMTLELADRSITYPKGLAEDIFVKVGNFHFPTDFVVVAFEADPRVPLILRRSFFRTNRALIDVYEGELVLRDGNEQITFMITDEPALVCSPPSEDVNDEKEKQEVKNLAESTTKRQTRITPCLKNFKVICKESIFNSNKTPQVSSVFAITSTLPSIEPKDYLIIRDEHLSTFSAEEIVLILRESEDTSESEILEDIECKDSYDSNLDESTFLVTPLFDSNKDECLTPKDDIEILLQHNPSTPMKSVASILEGFINDPLFEENDDLFDLECKTNDWKRILYDAPIDEAECFDPGGDNDEINAFLAIKVPTYIEEGYYDSEGDVLYLESLLSDDTTHNFSSEVFFDHEPENESLITFYPKSDPLHYEFTSELITIPLGIVREHKDYINRMSLLCDNSSSRSPENSHTIIESLPSSTTLIEDSDSNREGIDIFSGPDDSIPPGIESDFDSEEDIIDNLLNDDPIPEYERLTFDMEPDVPVINNVDELNEDECFDLGGGEINVEVDYSFTFVTRTFLPYLTYPECMRTRRSNYPNSNVTIPRRRRRQVSNIVEPEIRTIVAPYGRTYHGGATPCPTEGYGEAIVLPEINADHFEIKTNLLQLVQANPFYGRENDNPHAHINSFKRITSTLRFRNVPTM
ncbi:reverse transcriptase domain-containing protein [Tanacetum coccineum]